MQLLNLFAYGTYSDYIANKESLTELNTTQQNKLKHLTIMSLALRMKCIPYSVLLKDLEMRNLRELEDLIIEAVYTDIIQGKLDQRNPLLEVDFCIGRDTERTSITLLRPYTNGYQHQEDSQSHRILLGPGNGAAAA